MPVLDRYARPAFRTLWSEAAKLERWLRVELAALEAWEEEGSVPVGTAARIRAAVGALDPARVAAIEARVRHDVVAFTEAVAERAGADARFFHFGLTSSDVVDTALALALREASSAILAGLDGLIAALWRRAEAERETVTVGRTHGVFAEPLTFGVKLLHHALALHRDRLRLRRAAADVAVGKLSGAVGTFAQVPLAVEARALERLGLRPEPVATQVVARDRHAAYLATLAVLGGDLERLALEIRLLQRSEVREAREPFLPGQKGSSAMPHKQNPVVSERIAGLARVLRGYAVVGFEDQALWHERDISHSSAERVALADATTLADFLVAEATWLVEGLVIDRERMRAHVDAWGGLIFSQRALLALTRAGLTREEAYALVQSAALQALAGGSFREELGRLEPVRSLLPGSAFDDVFRLEPYLAHVDDLFARAAEALFAEEDA
jgi:adenylosuccinate lyase